MMIPKSIETLARQHGVNVSRDIHGNYYLLGPGGQFLESTMAARPTVANARAMIKRYLHRAKTRTNPKRRRRPVRTKSGRRGSPARATRAGTRRTANPAHSSSPKRKRYIATFGKRHIAFHSSSDANARRYATGLLAAKVGRAPTSLRVSGAAPARRKKKAQSRART